MIRKPRQTRRPRRKRPRIAAVEACLSLEELLENSTEAAGKVMHWIAPDALEFFKAQGVKGPHDRSETQYDIVLVATLLAGLASRRERTLRLLDLALRTVRARGPHLTEECNPAAILIRVLHDLRYLSELLL